MLEIAIGQASSTEGFIMTIKAVAACAALVSIVFAAPASAADGTISVGPSLVTDGDVRIWAGTARGALFFNEYFGVEGEASVGLNSDDIDIFISDENGLTVPVSSEVDLDSQLGVFAVGRYPFEGGSIFARLGYQKASFTASTDIPNLDLPDVDVDFDNIAFGIGGEYFFNDGPHGIRGDVTSITGDGNGLDGSIQTISLTYAFRFGG